MISLFLTCKVTFHTYCTFNENKTKHHHTCIPVLNHDMNTCDELFTNAKSTKILSHQPGCYHSCSFSAVPRRSAPVSSLCAVSGQHSVSGLANLTADCKSVRGDLQTEHFVTQQRDQNSLKPHYKRLQHEGLEESQIFQFIPSALSHATVSA